MKYLAILLLLMGGIACNSSQNDPEQAIEDNLEQPAEPLPQAGVNPGELNFVIKILETYNSSKEICGLAKANVALVKIMEMGEGGMGIVNLPKKSDEMQVAFLLPSEALQTGALLEATAKESLCPEASKTYYTIKNYKIVE
ncbi:hypothetical protein [Poritiphilus flavus]|uniref:YCII-related domain-containing protein n=1 Tax=Poritiphilus flavus TaxID=2697053 RepID=A0A6L9ED73_9FLAO|nr:hypothetical protein [Poritiphilus flavus]NAS12498.1 hypothetical protein [Poritiphilus flavus]